MKRSATGLVFVILYWIACAAAWFDYAGHRGQFLADILLVLLTAPFLMLAGMFAGSSNPFDRIAETPALLISAILFCSILVYALGALAGRMTSWLRGGARPPRASGP